MFQWTNRKLAGEEWCEECMDDYAIQHNRYTYRTDRQSSLDALVVNTFYVFFLRKIRKQLAAYMNMCYAAYMNMHYAAYVNMYYAAYMNMYYAANVNMYYAAYVNMYYADFTLHANSHYWSIDVE